MNWSEQVSTSPIVRMFTSQISARCDARVFGNIPEGLGEAEKVRGEAVLRAENLYANEATILEVEDDLWKVVLVIEWNRDRDPPS